MAVIEINRHPSRRQLNRFGFVWLGFVSVFGAVAWFKLANTHLAWGLWVAAVVVPVVGWLVPAFMRLVFVGMSSLTWPIGFVVSCAMLALVYFLVLTPIGLFMRLFGYDPMRRGFDRDADSYWVLRPASSPEARHYFRQF